MQREIVISKDGSPTFYWPKFDEHYHSIHGAITESMHVFIQAGLQYVTQKEQPIQVLEMGFGTGLNCLLTNQFAQENDCFVNYHSIEAFPLSQEEVKQLQFSFATKQELNTIHQPIYNQPIQVTKQLALTKYHQQLQEFTTLERFHVIYYDAFAPSAQPELWETSIFEKLFHLLQPNGCLVTYCAKGQVKRNLKAVGFEIEALPGPPGKREMTRAIKTS